MFIRHLLYALPISILQEMLTEQKCASLIEANCLSASRRFCIIVLTLCIDALLTDRGHFAFVAEQVFLNLMAHEKEME